MEIVIFKNQQNYSSYIKMKQLLQINMTLSHLTLQVKYDIVERKFLKEEKW